jgi:HPt (histidine-containing phosphotransfer) domain-containing protein
MDDVPVFDRRSLLNATCDDRELAGQVVEVFLADIPKQMASLDAALADGDAGIAERVAHSIKGASATVGGERLRAVAFECETLGREGRLAEVLRRVPALRDAYAELEAALKEEGFAGE